jgi:hypothetical protein
MNNFSFYLFARPSFWEGVGRIMDFGDILTEYNQSLTPEQADELAYRADAAALSQDMQAAFAALESETDAMHGQADHA